MQRRQALKIIGAAGITGLSGCSGGGSSAATTTKKSTTTVSTTEQTAISTQTETPIEEFSLPESQVYTEDPYVIEERDLSLSANYWSYTDGVPYFNTSSEEVEILEPRGDVFFTYGLTIYNRGGEVKETLDYQDFFLWVDGKSYLQSMNFPGEVEYEQIRDDDQDYHVEQPWWTEPNYMTTEEIEPGQSDYPGFLFDVQLSKTPESHYLVYDGEFTERPVFLGT